MLSAGLILLLSAGYMGLLFAVARFGDARADAGQVVTVFWANAGWCSTRALSAPQELRLVDQSHLT